MTGGGNYNGINEMTKYRPIEDMLKGFNISEEEFWGFVENGTCPKPKREGEKILGWTTMQLIIWRFNYTRHDY
jgi:predicted DNA-binding transcriptional regulator AlpA